MHGFIYRVFVAEVFARLRFNEFPRIYLLICNAELFRISMLALVLMKCFKTKQSLKKNQMNTTKRRTSKNCVQAVTCSQVEIHITLNCGPKRAHAIKVIYQRISREPHHEPCCTLRQLTHLVIL